MKKLCLLLFLAAPSAVKADLTHTITSSAQLTVNSAISQVERIGSSFSISGTGVDATIDSAGQISTGAISSGVYSPGTVVATQNATDGESFSFSQTYTQADAIAGSAPTVGEVPNFSNVTSHSAGVVGDLAGGVTSAGVVSLTAGGAGTVATGSVVTSISIE